MPTDHAKTIEELEGEDWGEPQYESHVVQECHRLRRVPLKALTIENLRLLITQAIGLQYLVPLALDRLTVDPFATGEYYAGDLFAALLRLDKNVWRQHPEWTQRMRAITEHAVKDLRGCNDRERGELLQEMLGEWLRHDPDS